MQSTDMKPAVCRRSVRGSMAAAALGLGVAGISGALAAGPPLLPAHLSGAFNDYTPVAPTVAGGPYEMHGKWSLQLREERGTASFAADMTMQTADFANSDPNHDPTKLSPHTHHISVTDGVIHNDATDPIRWSTSCPSFKPPVAGGFVVTGTAYVTGNGGSPPFGNPSPVTICILGGAENPSSTAVQTIVRFANFTLTFATGSRASSHFGTQAINGVVASCYGPWDHESNDCKVVVSE
ncbi:MAG TPA: hypothetical protein VMU00_01135 [Steroidobacteraceae bacterium]|nr:hypothetical protein [Steroidobacteraceae bacterium]